MYQKNVNSSKISSKVHVSQNLCKPAVNIVHVPLVHLTVKSFSKLRFLFKVVRYYNTLFECLAHEN